MTSDANDAPPGERGGGPTLADDALLAPLRETDDPVLTTGEVSDTVPFGRRATAEGLERLASEGVVERKSVGDGAVWWLPGHTDTNERRGPMPGATREYDGGLSTGLENAISTLSVPDERERGAVYATCYFLAEYGPAAPEKLRAEVYPNYPAGHDDAASWWTETIRPAIGALDGVERDGDAWRVAADEE
ncbi:hypothetical protein [Halorussus sp. AFM4]|uniref:hypothetical protein n=1 Tax=Halorussus sp. AFM4 TaxID=3421651 RepID=UPI003EB8CFF0